MNTKDRKAIESLYFRAEDMSRDVYRAFTMAKEGERAHRRMGRGVSGGYGAPVDTCAMYFALKGFCAPIGSHSVTHRLDFVLGYSAALEARARDAKLYRAIVRAARPLIDRLEYPFTGAGGAS